MRYDGAVFLAVIMLNGCRSAGESSPSSVSSERTGRVETIAYDFGEVNVSAGARTVEHIFEIENNSSSSLEIASVKVSCGCMHSGIESSEVAPWGSVPLRLTMTMPGVGEFFQGATVVFSDGTAKRFDMLAKGVVPASLSVILSGPYVDAESLQLALRLYYLSERDPEGPANPIVQSPSGVSLHFNPWITIEHSNLEHSRPSRQIANCVLDFAEYVGTFPAEVEIAMPNGCSSTVLVHARRDSSGMTARSVR